MPENQKIGEKITHRAAGKVMGIVSAINSIQKLYKSVSNAKKGKQPNSCTS